MPKVEEHQVGWYWMSATVNPRIQGDVQPREPGDMDRHQTRYHLSISRFSEAFSTFDQTCLRKQHIELQKSLSSESQWIYYQPLLFCMSSAVLMWIMNSNGSGIKASWSGPEQAQVYRQKYLRKGFSCESQSLHEGSNSMNGRSKKLTKPFLGWDKKQRGKFKKVEGEV